MKKEFVIVGLFLALLWPMAANAQRGGCCVSMEGSASKLAPGTEYPAIAIGLAGTDQHGCWLNDQWIGLEACTNVVPTPVPTPVPPEVGGWWDLIKSYADKFVIWKGDAASVARILAMLLSFLGIVQAFKKGLESAAKWAWLVKLIPGIGGVLNFFAHGWGPMILNALITGGTLAVAAFQDGVVTAGEVLLVVSGVVGVDLLYRAIRGWLFPKTA
jgi:hypothetical protein